MYFPVLELFHKIGHLPYEQRLNIHTCTLCFMDANEVISLRPLKILNGWYDQDPFSILVIIDYAPHIINYALVLHNYEIPLPSFMHKLQGLKYVKLQKCPNKESQNDQTFWNMVWLYRLMKKMHICDRILENQPSGRIWHIIFSSQ